jgi:hypothetical protein
MLEVSGKGQSELPELAGRLESVLPTRYSSQEIQRMNGMVRLPPSPLFQSPPLNERDSYLAIVRKLSGLANAPGVDDDKKKELDFSPLSAGSTGPEIASIGQDRPEKQVL